MRHLIISLLTLIILATSATTLTSCRRHRKAKAEPELSAGKREKVGDFWVVQRPTPNVGRGKNEVKGIVLHHTAIKSIDGALDVLSPKKSGKTQVSSHVVIDRDGTRYILARPEQITWHAGYSTLNGRDNCNKFTIGIELHGNTASRPLTKEQIRSAVAYMLPIIKEHDIKISDIVTHRQIRKNYQKKHPRKNAPDKGDITDEEYHRVIAALKDSLAR